MAKAELFRYRPMAWFFSRGGGFPVRRGRSDPEAITTAQAILDAGGLVGIFPEGTRLRHGGLGKPRRGAGRLAVHSGATVVPVTVIGSERIRRLRVLVLPVRCGVYARSGRATARDLDPTPEAAAAVIDRAWVDVQAMWDEHGGSPEPGRR